MSESDQKEELDLIGNILSEEDKDDDYSPEAKAKNTDSFSPDLRKNIKL
jgi:hypothetical protein